MHPKYVEIKKLRTLEEIQQQLARQELMLTLLCEAAGVELPGEEEPQAPAEEAKAEEKPEPQADEEPEKPAKKAKG